MAANMLQNLFTIGGIFGVAQAPLARALVRKNNRDSATGSRDQRGFVVSAFQVAPCWWEHNRSSKAKMPRLWEGVETAASVAKQAHEHRTACGSSAAPKDNTCEGSILPGGMAESLLTKGQL